MQINNFNKQFWHRLPHFQPENGLLFITFRLHFSLSAKIVNEISSYKTALIKTIKRGPLSQNIISKKVFDFQDKQLASIKVGGQYLQDARIAQIVSDIIVEGNSNIYDLFCFTIMPNHVHLLIRIREKEEGVFHTLPYIMKKIKGSSAYKANQALHRSGTFWDREYYDYCARSEREANNIVQYIIMNPVRAGLCSSPEEWKWTWINHELLA
jgi:putative transposase